MEVTKRNPEGNAYWFSALTTVPRWRRARRLHQFHKHQITRLHPDVYACDASVCRSREPCAMGHLLVWERYSPKTMCSKWQLPWSLLLQITTRYFSVPYQTACLSKHPPNIEEENKICSEHGNIHASLYRGQSQSEQWRSVWCSLLHFERASFDFSETCSSALFPGT